MNKKIRLIGLTLGDPFSEHSRSGVNYNVFSRLAKKCELIDVLDLDIQGVNKYWLAFKNISFNRRRWGNKIHQNPKAFYIRTQMAECRLKEIQSKFDLVFQDGAMFMPGRECKIPFVSYHDSNVILSSQKGGLGHGAHYRGINLEKAIGQEKKVYEGAAIIFTMSDWLKASLVQDFRISEDKIITVYAGTNLKINDFEKSYDKKTILFVGKNFERKGGRVLIDAFKLVRKEVKGAKLIVIGPNLNIQEEGVEVKGLITNKEELSEYFRQASIFVLPSLFEPFGIVCAEAFSFKNPCIGTNICAMPEIIEDGIGGFLVPPHDYRILAEKIITLLKDENLLRKMGNYGFEKVRNMFNWDTVVNKMLFQCTKLV